MNYAADAVENLPGLLKMGGLAPLSGAARSALERTGWVDALRERAVAEYRAGLQEDETWTAIGGWSGFSVAVLTDFATPGPGGEGKAAERLMTGGEEVLARVADDVAEAWGEALARVADEVTEGGARVVEEIAEGAALGGANTLSKVEGVPWGRYCASGCEDVAAKIQGVVGGEIKTLRPTLPRAQTLGPRVGVGDTYWATHDVVVKDGMVYDALTGPAGMATDAYKALWGYADVIDFGF